MINECVQGGIADTLTKKYGMTKSNICVIIKKEKITKVKVGVQNLIVNEELEKVMAKRLAQFGSYRVQ